MPQESESSKLPGITRYKGFVLSEGIERRGVELLRNIGYILLGLFLVDFLGTLIPPHLFDPIWELGIVNSLVDKSWLALLGFGLIFFYKIDTQLKRGFLRVIYYLSWASLILSIFYFLLFPLTLFDGFKILNRYKTDSTIAIASSQAKAEQIRARINLSNSPQQIASFIQALNPQKLLIDQPTLQQLKEQANKELDIAKKDFASITNSQTRAKSIQLGKSSVRAALGTVISGLGLGLIWRSTRWVRVLFKKNPSKNDD